MAYTCPNCGNKISKWVLIKKYVDCQNCGSKVTVSSGVSAAAGLMGFFLFGMYKAGAPVAAPIFFAVIGLVLLSVISGRSMKVKGK